MSELTQYAPIILFVTMFFLRNKIFVTPEQLEEKISTLKETVVTIETYEKDQHERKAEFNEVKGELKEAVKLLTSLAQTQAVTQKDIEYIKKAIDSMPTKED